jgi:DNA-binding XRE family transcriptional regulator
MLRNGALYCTFLLYLLSFDTFLIKMGILMHFYVYYQNIVYFWLNSIKMHVTQTIRQRRKVLQITQQTLAELSGIGLRTIKELETGQGNPTLEVLEKVAGTLGMELVLQVKSMDHGYEAG